MISRSFCWAIMKKMTKKWNLETSNVETRLKIGIYAKNWVKQVLLKNFYYGQSQRSTVKVNDQLSTDDMCWRDSVTSPRAYVARREAQQACGARVARGRAWDWRVADTGGAWSACSWGRNFNQHVAERVMQFLAVLRWVLLGIGCSVFLCLFFGCWMSRTLISESCRYCGRDGGGSLLTVTTRWRRGQRKNAEDIHWNQKVRGMALIPC